MPRISKENYYLDIAETVLERATCLRRPQNDLRLVGRVELPPIESVPLSSQGYIVMLAQ